MNGQPIRTRCKEILDIPVWDSSLEKISENYYLLYSLRQSVNKRKRKFTEDGSSEHKSVDCMMISMSPTCQSEQEKTKEDTTTE